MNKNRFTLLLVLAVSIIKPAFAQQYPATVPGFMQWFSDSVQNGINGIIRASISPTNPTINSTRLTGVTNSTISAINNLGNAGYNIAQAIANFVNSFYGIHISFWLILAISSIIGLVFIHRNGEEMLKKTIILILIVVAIIIIIPILGLQNSILSNLP